MISDLREHLEKLFNHDELVKICHVMGFHPMEPLAVTFNTAMPQHTEAVHCMLRYHNGLVADWWLSPLPGNYDILVSHGVSVEQRYRGKGLGSVLHGLRIQAAKACGAGAIACTVRADNAAERKILHGHGWHESGGFNAGDHRVEFWIKEL